MSTENMLSILPQEISTKALHSYLLGAIAPRPIAFASTVDKDNRPNLSPFSFFNIFSASPPILIFSPARSGRTGANKNTYENVKEVPEVVINMVSYNLVQQCSLSSTEYPKGVNEFEKAGLTPIASDLIRPFRVKESPVQLECKVNQVIELSTAPGSGNLIICEIIKVHIDKSVLDEQGNIDPQKIDLVARMGANYYCRASGSSVFEVEKPLAQIGVGVDAIPASIRNSNVLTGNELGILGNVAQLPSLEEIVQFKTLHLTDIYGTFNGKEKGEISPELTTLVHLKAKAFLGKNDTDSAWLTLLSSTI